MKLFEDGRNWEVVRRSDARARALADRHYSRQSPGTREFMASGRTLVLLGPGAVWGAIENLDPVGQLRWRVSVFRNEGPILSSVLVREATELTRTWWAVHYRGEPGVPLQTEVDPKRTRAKRDPGRCFRRAGWRHVDTRRGLVILEAPATTRAARSDGAAAGDGPKPEVR